MADVTLGGHESLTYPDESFFGTRRLPHSIMLPPIADIGQNHRHASNQTVSPISYGLLQNAASSICSKHGHMVSSVHNLLDQEAQKAAQGLHFVVATLV